ncbi:hypothetical protein [uncultured Neptuniibacter sp.]|uniref:hypothetical protein n=1 Tax=uncultured Neptuniibacter sp. TaxID=502143 RepID=UPI0026345A6D|nr:hypothetical protein [uncultured Neptuniibacter sp.]
MMKLKILDTKNENGATCYLCKVDLKEYISSVPANYKDFGVQRGIVSNKYLDHLVDTIHGKKHIPAIVLVSNETAIRGEDLYIEEFKILDGLQRTHRLKVIHETITKLLEKKDFIENLTSSSSFFRKHSSSLKAVGANRQLVKALIEFEAHRLCSPLDFFDDNNLWLEVWDGLTEEQQIQKMLLLNAGHKSVNIKHQLELLFLGTLLKLEEISPQGVRYLREKEVSAIQYSKSRSLGSYHFSHIISALIALSAGKIVNTNSDFISQLQSGSLPEVDLIEGFDFQFLKLFVQFIYNFDRYLYEEYEDVGLKWFGREVVLIGIFGAIGALSNDTDKSLVELITDIDLKIPSLVKTLRITDFEIERNRVELNKVNVGVINKKAVYNAVYDFLSGQEFSSWSFYFGGSPR